MLDVKQQEYGAVAQLVAHLHGMQGVRGSSPLSSTTKGPAFVSESRTLCCTRSLLIRLLFPGSSGWAITEWRTLCLVACA